MNTFFGVQIQKPQPLVGAIRSVVAAKRRPVAARDRVYASEISACDRRIRSLCWGANRTRRAQTVRRRCWATRSTRISKRCWLRRFRDVWKQRFE